MQEPMPYILVFMQNNSVAPTLSLYKNPHSCSQYKNIFSFRPAMVNPCCQSR